MRLPIQIPFNTLVWFGTKKRAFTRGSVNVTIIIVTAGHLETAWKTYVSWRQKKTCQIYRRRLFCPETVYQILGPPKTPLTTMKSRFFFRKRPPPPIAWNNALHCNLQTITGTHPADKQESKAG